MEEPAVIDSLSEALPIVGDAADMEFMPNVKLTSEKPKEPNPETLTKTVKVTGSTLGRLKSHQRKTPASQSLPSVNRVISNALDALEGMAPERPLSKAENDLIECVLKFDDEVDPHSKKFFHGLMPEMEKCIRNVRVDRTINKSTTAKRTRK